MIKRIWQGFCQWRADIHFYKWIKMPDKYSTVADLELSKYYEWIDIKFMFWEPEK